MKKFVLLTALLSASLWGGESFSEDHPESSIIPMQQQSAVVDGPGPTLIVHPFDVAVIDGPGPTMITQYA